MHPSILSNLARVKFFAKTLNFGKVVGDLICAPVGGVGTQSLPYYAYHTMSYQAGWVHWTRGAPGSPVVAVVLLLIVVIVVVTLDQGCAKDLLWFQFLGLLAIAPAHSQGLTKMFFLLKLQMKDLVCILRLGTVVL